MNLQIIKDCAGTDPVLSTAGTDPDRRYATAFRFIRGIMVNITYKTEERNQLQFYGRVTVEVKIVSRMSCQINFSYAFKN